MYVGIDLGGTNIAGGVVDEQGRLMSKYSLPTRPIRPCEEYVKDIIEVAKKVIKDADLEIKDIKALGIGAPGIIDTENGVVYASDNIGMDGFPLAEYVFNGVGLPTYIENDANAAAFGEYIICDEKVDSFVFITLGTGVGCGVIIDGKMLRGFNGSGSELGHTIINFDGAECNCGKRGCWETYASVTALIRQTKEMMKKSPDSLMYKLVEKEGKVSGKTAFDAAKQGDIAAEEVVKKYTEYIAIGIMNSINIFHPNKIVIGGGISKEGEYILNPVLEYIRSCDRTGKTEKCNIEIAKLFNDAGIIGAALATRVK